MEKNQTTNKDSILIVGSGPSAADPKAAYLKDANTKVFRLNWFFLESNLVFGKQVDWCMFNYREVILFHLLRQVIEGRYYEFNQLHFSPDKPKTITEYTQFYREYFGDDYFQSLYKRQRFNWPTPATIGNLVTDYNRRLGIKSIRKTTMPTAAVMTLAKVADAGFKDIRLAGVDFYMDSTLYGYHPLPKHLAHYRRSAIKIEQLNKVHKLLGKPLLKEDYWRPQTTSSIQSRHAVDLDTAIINHVLSSYPDIQLTVFCTDPALAVWQQVKGIKLLAAGDIQDTAPAPDNRFIPLLDTIKLNRAQQRKIVILMRHLLLRVDTLIFIRTHFPNLYPILRPLYRFIRDRTWIGRWV